MLRVIGRGGMGVVLEAMDLNLKRSVALKLILAATGGSFDSKGYFAREARSLAAVQHPGVVRVLDGDIAGDTPYLAMELLAGETLHELTVIERPTLAQVAGWLDGLLDALAAVHERGMLHRDLKPSNIFIEESGRPVLIDFGLVANPATTRLTETGTVLGTPRFLAPELIASGSPTPSSDLYALAMSMVEVLIGRSPHIESGGSNRLEVVLESIQSGAYLGRVRAELPAGPVTDVLLKALARKPADRFADAKSMRAALARAVAAPARRPPAPTPRARAKAPVLAALMICGALGGLTIAVPRPQPSEAPVSTPAPPSAEPVLSAASALVLRDRINDLVLPVSQAVDIELKGFRQWQLATQLEGKNIEGTTRDLKRQYLATRKRAGGAVRLETLAREASRLIDAVRAPARAFLAADQPAHPAVQVAFRLADVRECGLVLDVLGTHAAGQLVHSWTDGQPASFGAVVLQSLVRRSDRRHGERLTLLEEAAGILDGRRRRGPVDVHDAVAMSSLLMEMMDALRNVRPSDPERNRPLLAWWAPWSAMYPREPILVDVDRKIRSGQ